MFDRNGPTFWELAEQALSSTDRGYDLLAPKFDHTPFRTPDSILQKVSEAIAGRQWNIDTALDVCCGTGAAMRWIRPLAKSGVVGIDRSTGMLHQAALRMEREAPGTAPFAFVRGDALTMPFEECFDLATCFGAFGHILESDEPHFVRSVHSSLRKGGRFVFVTSELPPLWSPGRWMARAFNAAIRVRNMVLKPEFIMYYLTFLWPSVGDLLVQHGFHVEVIDDAFQPPFNRLLLVIATRT